LLGLGDRGKVQGGLKGVQRHKQPPSVSKEKKRAGGREKGKRPTGVSRTSWGSRSSTRNKKLGTREDMRRRDAPSE